MSEADNYECINALSAFSILNDPLITEKFISVNTNMQFDVITNDLMETIRQMQDVCEIARAKGILALASYSDNTDNVFLKNILFMLSRKWIEFAGQPAMLYYWVKPILLSNSLKGVEFIKAILIYEGIVMATCGGFAPELIEFRLKSLLGETLLLENMIP